MLLETLRADGILSFAPGSPAISLRPLNVIIGPNGSGKSNLIEIIELLAAAPTGIAPVIRQGGGAPEWLWKGRPPASEATIEARLVGAPTALRYKLSLAGIGPRFEVVDEILDEADDASRFVYQFRGGQPTMRLDSGGEHQLRRGNFAIDQSILSQRKEPDLYPELAWCADRLSRIQTFREWSFGRDAALRMPQPADLPTDRLLADARNLGLLFNQLDHGAAGPGLREVLRRFLPRVERITTLVQANSIQLFLHEEGLRTPVPAARLSDGTLRFLAMAALLVAPDPPPLICIEEPELGLHPDALSTVAQLLTAASERTQLVVTTHSDALVSALTDHVDSVLVCEHRGGSQLRHLEADRLQHWLENYRLGDLWRMGELGGNP
ncbi:MAG TPA: AAA family ATPase [Kofleriaceae bacterium]|nr:AAA family ATPase [Kofleriaceae bacterium]